MHVRACSHRGIIAHVTVKVIKDAVSSHITTLFSTLFTKTTDIHCYATRQVNNYYPPRCKTETAKTSLRYAGTFLWNNLPPEIKTFNGTLSVFKKNIIKIWFSV